MKTAEEKANELYPIPEIFKGAVTDESLQQNAFLKGYEYANQQSEQDKVREAAEKVVKIEYEDDSQYINTILPAIDKLEKVLKYGGSN